MTLALVQRELSAFLRGEENAAAALVLPDAERLLIYANNYRMGLIGALGDTYEQLWSWLGDMQFGEACDVYIRAHPPQDWTLNSFGAGFVEVLETRYPDDPEIGDLARLDWAWRRAFDGPHDASLLADGLAGIDMAEAIIRPVGTCQFVTVRSNAAAIWSALGSGETVPAPELFVAPSTLCIWRKRLTPQFRPIGEREHEALIFIESGASFASLCDAMAGHNEAETAQRMGAWLARWIEDELISLTSG